MLINQKIAVISDIHANAYSLKLVLSDISSRDINSTIFMGDLLTYGCEPMEVIDLISEYASCNDCIFIKGNHDQFYFDIQSGCKKNTYKLPEFVQESVDWTVNKISNINLCSKFDWVESYKFGEVYFSHANPFGYGNWEYVESDAQLVRVKTCLNELDIRVGVFGHSHRARAVKLDDFGKFEHLYDEVVKLNSSEQYLLNPGSVGQPRGEPLGFIVMKLIDDDMSVEFIGVEIDLNYMRSLTVSSGMSEATCRKIMAYLESASA